ncbi:MAG: SGNH/GDSL hydrolase family protein [Bacteroidales bacterium]|nr:SGNH/GDSL hydrolase family protein [Bacteroidales bacterium]
MRAETTGVRYTEAATLTLVGKLFPDTPQPYHRLDTVRYKGFTKSENRQVRQSSGLAVAFRTDSPFIRVRTEYAAVGTLMNTCGIAARGYDLYIKDIRGQWLYAGSGANGNGRESDPLTLVKDMDGEMHECLLYLPLFSEVRSVQIGVREGSTLAPLGTQPFRHRIGIFGSSFTHGASATRSGMSYPAQFTRKTGIQLLSLGCSGNCKLQSYFADALADAEVEAFLFDTFSNPNVAEIRSRLFPFIERIQGAHPGKPLIFQRTIYREGRNFDQGADYIQRRRTEVADSMMNIACKRYKDVYYIRPNATSPDHLTSVDGIHPNDYGYTLWADSIERRVLAILRKYGIR